ncbi:MAG TPA: NUDIX hydrolase [Candidatus Limiplasma sp.]|nr:NUDIX hydrolase [Candidatus Limiplasma sp.]HPS81849.1 NUDIX hydrolase [Candidatus Limiplasma sp.]
MSNHPNPAPNPEDSAILETPLRDELVFHGALIDVTHMTVRLPNGREALREVVRHKGAAAVVPVDADGFVTLVRQHRVVVDQVTLEIPAGKLDHVGEDPLACAHRELEEETGLRARHMDLLCPMITTPGFCTEKVSIYLATGLSRYHAHLDEDEFLNVVRMPLEEAVSRAMRGELNDGKTSLGLLMAWVRLKGCGPA